MGIAPRVAGPIINIPVHDNQEVKAGDLLFEIDPADYKTALASAKASVANLETNLLQKQQDLDRETDLFRRNVDSKQLFHQTVDWVRLPQRFPVRIRITGKPPIPLRIGQTVTVAVVPNCSDKIAKQP